MLSKEWRVDRWKTAYGISVYFAGMSAWSSESESLLVTFDHGYVRANDIETVTIHQSLPSDAASWKSLTEQVTVFSSSISTMSHCDRILPVQKGE